MKPPETVMEVCEYMFGAEVYSKFIQVYSKGQNFTFTFTFIHLADAFIQSYFQLLYMSEVARLLSN